MSGTSGRVIGIASILESMKTKDGGFQWPQFVFRTSDEGTRELLGVMVRDADGNEYLDTGRVEEVRGVFFYNPDGTKNYVKFKDGRPNPLPPDHPG